LAISIVLFGCGPEPEPEPSDGGVLDTSDAAGRHDGGGLCCPIDITESTPCGCWRIGGHASTLAACPQHCDGTGYSEQTDEHGCPVLRHYGLGSCLPDM